MNPKLIVFAAPALVLLGACASQRTSGAAPTPQRPRLSHNASTTAEGTLELEAGVDVDPNDFIDTPVLAKYGVSKRTEFFVGGSPLRHNDNTDNTGIGDLVFGARHRLVEETSDSAAIAISTLIKLPTADSGDGLGTGETDVFFGAAIDKQFETLRGVGFYRLGLLGSPTGDGSDIRHDLAGVGSMNVAQNLNVYAELAGIFIPEYDFESVFTTLGAAFVIGPSTVFDVGCRLALSDDAPSFVLLAGITHNFGASVGR